MVRIRTLTVVGCLLPLGGQNTYILYGNGDVVQCPALPELGSERKAFLKVKWLAKVGLIVMSRQGESGESGRTSYQTVRVM